VELALDNTTLVAAALLSIALGSIFKGITGVGLPILAVPMIASFTSVADAVVLMVLPGLAANSLVIFTHRKWHLISQHKVFLITGFVAGFFGTWLLSIMGDRALKLLLAVWLGIYLVQYFSRKSGNHEFSIPDWLTGIFGTCAGTIQGAMGISASIVGPYYHASGLARETYAFMTAFTFLLFGVAQFSAMSQVELLSADRLSIGALAIIPTLFFTQFGIKISSRISEKAFNGVLILLFVLMEIKLLLDIAGVSA
jgi:uncharacterized membrane protein YfcA